MRSASASFGNVNLGSRENYEILGADPSLRIGSFSNDDGYDGDEAL